MTKPSFIPPMLATLVGAPFDDPDWLFEVKWDGFRVETVVDGDGAVSGSVAAKDLRRRVHILLARTRRVVEPVALFPRWLAGLAMPLSTGLAALATRSRLRIGTGRRSRERSSNPG
ncbi:MAG: hypothetical protein ABI628_06295 [Chloroflexota bacterium]